MDPRQFTAAKLARLSSQPAGKLVQEFPLIMKYWLQFIETSEDRAQAWDRSLNACPSFELWTTFLQSPEGSSVEAAERAKNAIGTYFLSAEIWRKLVERASNESQKLLFIKEAIRAPLYDYAEFYQLANDLEAEPYEKLASMAETVADITTQCWEFESQLQTQEFQTRELGAELDVWNRYLDYAESLLDKNLEHFDLLTYCVQLYRRCLVITALYPPFWRRYAAFLTSHEIDNTEVLKQAVHYHPKNKSLRELLISKLTDKGEIQKAREYLDTEALVKFDLAHNLAPQTDDVAYQAVYNQATGKPVTLEMVKQAPQLFNTVSDPSCMLDAWKEGLCADPAAFAERLKAAGHLKEFFTVDATLTTL